MLLLTQAFIASSGEDLVTQYFLDPNANAKVIRTSVGEPLQQDAGSEIAATSSGSASGLTTGLIAVQDLLFANLLSKALEAEKIVDLSVIVDAVAKIDQVSGVGSERDAILIAEASILNGQQALAIDQWISQQLAPVAVVAMCSDQQMISREQLTARFGNHWALITRQGCSLDRLVLAIRTARQGLMLFEPCASSNDNPAAPDLTEVERRTLRAISSGMSNAAAARELHVSEKTIERTLRSCYRKLGLSDGSKGDSNPRVLAALRYHGLQQDC